MPQNKSIKKIIKSKKIVASFNYAELYSPKIIKSAEPVV